MNVATGRGSWHAPQPLLHDDDDDDDDQGCAVDAQAVATAAKENVPPARGGRDMSKVAHTVASQLLCELALELD
jgi:hypothetical protein